MTSLTNWIVDDEQFYIEENLIRILIFEKHLSLNYPSDINIVSLFAHTLK